MEKKVLLFIIFAAYLCNIHAQLSDITKTLHVEDDGFVWYELKKNELYGASNVEGKTIVPINYSNISYYCQDRDEYNEHKPTGVHYFEVEEDEYTGVYTREGTMVIPTSKHFTFVILQNLDDKWYWNVDDDSGEGLLDIRGREIISTKKGYKYIQIFKSYESNCPIHILIEKNDYTGVCDLNGNVIITPDKYKGCRIDYNYLKVRLPNNKWKTLPAVKINQNSNFDFNIFDKLHYNYSKDPDKILAVPTGQVYNVKSDGTYMNVYTTDKKQLLFSSRIYKQIDIVSGEGQNYCFKVSKSNTGGLYGIVDKNGKEIVPCEMEALESAGTGYLKYKINGFWGLMDYAGKILIDTDRGYTSIGDFKTFNKRFPYTMAGYKGECDATGKQLSKIKVEAPQQSVASSSSSSTSSSTSRTGTTQTVVVEHHRDPIPMQEWQACFGCGGMGTMGCHSCGGSGTKYIGDRLHRCGLCNGRGIIPCNVCYGNKGKYITVYK